MGMVGCLGDIVFTVSDRTIKTIDNVTWSGSARYATHQRHGTHALTEFTGLDPDKMSFDIVLSAYLGVDPITEVVKLWNYERSGIAVPLVIGNKGYGKYRWSVLDHKMKMKTYDGRGNVTSATVTVNLQEYLRRCSSTRLIPSAPSCRILRSSFPRGRVPARCIAALACRRSLWISPCPWQCL